jgi:hypothetical protein
LIHCSQPRGAATQFVGQAVEHGLGAGQGLGRLCDASLQALHRVGQPRRVDRFDHVVDRAVLEGLQARAQIGQAGARRGGLRQPGASVRNPQRDTAGAVVAPPAHLDAAALFARVDAMSRRVFHQRQQGHGGEAQTLEFGREGDLELQPVGHAQVHQLEVGAHQLHFGGERGVGSVQARHRSAQVGDQVAQHGRRAV